MPYSARQQGEEEQETEQGELMMLLIMRPTRSMIWVGSSIDGIDAITGTDS